jgi:GT2 family glycosyltransferase
MARTKPYLSIIIPTFNEERRIPATLLQLDKHLSAVPYTYEIIVVNDCSTDRTGEIIRGFASLIKNLYVIDHTKRHGKGAAVKKGILAARGRYRLFTDADHPVSIAHFTNDFYPLLREEKKHIIVGTWDPEEQTALSLVERFTKWIARMGIKLFALPEIKNTQAGFKCFSEEAAQAVFPLQRVNSWGFDAEILLLAERRGYEICEIPVICRNHAFSHVGKWDMVHVAIDAIKTRFHLKKNRYELDKIWDIRL